MKLFLLFLLSLNFSCHAQGIIDLHTHLASHIPYGFMLFGGTPLDSPQEITHQHTFDQQMYTQWLIDSGIKIFVSAALTNPFAINKKISMQQIQKQIQFTNFFIQKNSKHFSLATNPKEARMALGQGKIVFIHALEGAEGLLETKEQVAQLKQWGISIIAPIHLIDIDYGDASILKGAKAVLNWKGWLRENIIPYKRVGITSKGRKALEYLMKEKIIIDAAHMSSLSFDQALEQTKSKNIPLLVSHTYLKSIHSDKRALSDD